MKITSASDILNIRKMKTKESGLNRRDFIKAGAGAGLLIGTGTYGSLMASGASSQPPVRIGFVGVGSGIG